MCALILLCLLSAWITPAAGLAQDREVGLTVYSNNLGLVREVRTLDLAKGRTTATLAGVPAQIDPTSVRVRSLAAPDRVAVLEQRFTYDLINPEILLSKYIDRDVEVEVEGSGTPVRGRLLGLGGDLTLMRENGSIDLIRRDAVRRVSLPGLPGGLVTRPALAWLVENTGTAGPQRIEVSYLTGGMSWHAEYTAVVSAQETELTLSGWASIDNRSGATYENAALTLVAGDVNRAEPERLPARMARTMGRVLAGEEIAQQFDEQPLFEYHAYTLDRRARVGDNETVQLALLADTKVRAKKQYIYDGARMPTAVQTRFEFENSQRAGLGLPLPRGKVRVYQEGATGSRQFLGEDGLKDLAKDETARVTVGTAFDLAGERKQTTVRQVSDRSREESLDIVLRNHTANPVTITVVEHLGRNDWYIRQSSQEYRKRDAWTIEFDVPVPKDGEARVGYTVVYRW
ncbi:MAG: DUF4139 domain-containing protein [Candidatus Latescibacteria bacterium]|nr:DUF4139 domain-containing protein [Candidatus Latescibacterota bacterium]